MAGRMTYGLAFIDKLDASTFTSAKLRRMGAVMVGNALLKKAAAFIEGKVSVVVNEDSASEPTLSVHCKFQDVGPGFLDEINQYLKEAIRVINAVDAHELEQAADALAHAERERG